MGQEIEFLKKKREKIDEIDNSPAKKVKKAVKIWR